MSETCECSRLWERVRRCRNLLHQNGYCIVLYTSTMHLPCSLLYNINSHVCDAIPNVEAVVFINIVFYYGDIDDSSSSSGGSFDLLKLWLHLIYSNGTSNYAKTLSHTQARTAHTFISTLRASFISSWRCHFNRINPQQFILERMLWKK